MIARSRSDMPKDTDPGWLEPIARTKIIRRQSSECFYCERILRDREIRMDHLVPKSKGGAHTHENRVASCVRCDRRKRNRMPYADEVHKQMKILIRETIVACFAERLRITGLPFSSKDEIT